MAKPKTRNNRPPMSPLPAFLITFGAAAAGGLLLGFIAGLTAGSLMRDLFFGFGQLVGGMGGMFIGYPIGATLGLLLLKKRWRFRGSVLLGMVGCLVGAVATMGPAEMFGITAAFSLPAYAVAVPLLGAIGFNLGKGKTGR